MTIVRNNTLSVLETGKSREFSGAVHVLALTTLTVLFIFGGYYLYSVNRSAVQGYHMRSLEKEIAILKQKNAELHIIEADLRSLQRIESSQEELKMQKLENVKYIEEGGPVAFR